MLIAQKDADQKRGVPAVCTQCERDILLEELLKCRVAAVTSSLLICPHCQT